MIVSSAIMFFEKTNLYNPIILTGLRHSDIYEKKFKLGLICDNLKTIEGFFTDSNQFLDRYDAKREAKRCDQIKVTDSCPKLYSEDIWPEE